VSTPTGDLIGAVAALGLLYWWARDRTAASAAAHRRREVACPHRPEWQETLRVNRDPFGWVVPGRRELVKHCRGCGRQRMLYGPNLQSWDSYVAEFRQETRDRTTEFRARRRAHLEQVADRDMHRAGATHRRCSSVLPREKQRY
jgi:hypothetical protein